MGGKKKTKWRKLPLEEFTTSECSKLKRRRSSEEYKSDSERREENAQNIPYPEALEENSQTYSNEFIENTDNVWYPTQYLIYNPVEVPFYPNYVMPSDPNYFYYPPSEGNLVSDYTGVPFQECIPPVKDTVYLLFPASALRPTQYSSYDWRNRRRRKRYSGYAEYAVIPEKTNVAGKPNETKEGSSTPLKSNIQTCQTEAISVKREKNCLEETKLTSQKPETRETDRKLDKTRDSVTKMGLSKSEKNEEPANKPKKAKNVCDVHSNVFKQDSDSNLNKKEFVANKVNVSNKSSVYVKTIDKDSTNEVLSLDLNSSRLCNSDESEVKEVTGKLSQNTAGEVSKTQRNNDMDKCDKVRNNLNINLNDGKPFGNLNSTAKEANEIRCETRKESKYLLNSNETYLLDSSYEKTESDQNSLNAPLPDIIRTVNKTFVPHKSENLDSLSDLNNDKTEDFSSLHNTKNINERASNIPSVSAARSAYLPYLYNANSDVVCSENKTVGEKTFKSQPLHTNNSIYKLAFDESITDQSDTESRSPSPINHYSIDYNVADRSSLERNPVYQQPKDNNPINRSSFVEGRVKAEEVDPESQVPYSLINHEINVYEADSGDDAGSEDLELIPHRYENESFLNKSKHLYENKLSLAVELLRTKENLPYDSQFKRVIEDSQEFAKTENNKAGKVNFGFVDDLNSLDSIELKNDNSRSSKPDCKVITNQCKTHNQITSNSTSYDIPLDDSLENSYELADEVVAQSANHQENREEMNAGYRRIGVQFRHYFSPSSTLVNPWNCCILM